MAPVQKKKLRILDPTYARNVARKRGVTRQEVYQGLVNPVRKAKVASQNVRRRRRISRGSYRQKKGMKMRKYRFQKKKPLYSVKRNLVRECYYNGCTIRQERGGVFTDNYCLAIGHTLPFLQMRRAFFMALLKKLFDKVGCSMESPEAIMNLTASGDQVTLYYRKAPGIVDNTLSNITHNFSGAASLADVTNGVIALYETAAIAGAFEDIQWESIMFYAGGSVDLGSHRISLIGATASYYMDSTMKLQNRTADGASNTQTDDLVAQHVTGKSYFGYGNYVQNRTRIASGSPSTTQITYIGNSVGVINAASTLNPDYQLKEPMPKSNFVNCISSHGIDFNPGEVKRSHLKYQCTMPINEFFKALVRRWDNSTIVVPSVIPYPIKKTKFRFFMLEKEIETIDAASPATPVTFGFEVDHTIGCVINPSKNTYLSRENFINTAVTNI